MGSNLFSATLLFMFHPSFCIHIVYQLEPVLHPKASLHFRPLPLKIPLSCNSYLVFCLLAACPPPPSPSPAILYTLKNCKMYSE
jgi:hypothetical protein